MKVKKQSFQYTKHSIRFAYLSGNSPYEIGFQHGSVLQTNLKRMTESVEQVIAQKSTRTLQKLFFKLLFRKVKSVENKFTPDFIQEMHGVANGSNVSYEYILAINLFYELAPLILKNLGIHVGACTVIIAPIKGTTQVIFAKTTDLDVFKKLIPIFVQSNIVVVRNELWRNARYITVTFPGRILGDTLIFDNGFVVGLNNGARLQKKKNNEYFPMARLFSEMVSNNPTEELLIKAIEENPTINAYKIAATDGTMKHSLLIDMCEKDYEIKRMKSLLINTNCFFSQKLIDKHYKKNYIETDSYHDSSARQALLNKSYKDVSNVNDMIDLVKVHTDDFDSLKGSISCDSTVHGLVYFPQKRKLYLPNDTKVPVTYYGTWHEFDVDELFGMTSNANHELTGGQSRFVD